MQNQKYLQEDKIDLRELFKIIWNYKIFVLVFTSIITFIALIYVLLKNPISIYQGKMYLEIGQIQNKNFAPISIEKVTDLAYILNLEFKVNSNIPKNTFYNSCFFDSFCFISIFSISYRICKKF
ncbi:Wzz/FepE/Etk N-terminal domain-containing protein [Aliarcobacter butzleri]|uniref:Wzz/FepE/Etk N-terminal domain-containing protein n=1 Tax=Aliarcobacter butzleri TaxID=28197 RepID=UPI0002295BE2|nr:Wzz/FepE/Etk N-terminal domain-containing protein [Aliarcobacter butzleri]QDM00873.1 hypothetical protein FM022_03220 [Aliarcobacter butzleri]UWY60817.1 Wzz/FepE/Etk N-terminal domain-containing protein [Aliarcobacter butzleri]BAK70333.1 exopolysaccharide biosynthesis protein [Aliarcobacter butzleri ED-1]